jgi:hypothetical protein
MEATEADLERQACEVHPDRQSVARCAECKRATCLSCAVPFRGDVLCTSCAARALGEPTPPPQVPASPRGLTRTAGVLLGVALVLTIPPWHWFGPLNQPFSAWRAEPDVWPTVACGLLAASAIVLLWSATRRPTQPRVAVAAFGVLAALAAAATLRAFLGTLDFVRHTPAPIAVMLAAALAAGAAGAQLVRSRP